jgi:hypothetical protein
VAPGARESGTSRKARCPQVCGLVVSGKPACDSLGRGAADPGKSAPVMPLGRAPAPGSVAQQAIGGQVWRGVCQGLLGIRNVFGKRCWIANCTGTRATNVFRRSHEGRQVIWWQLRSI